MLKSTKKRVERREFLRATIFGSALGGLALTHGYGSAAAAKPVLEAGEAVIDTTPPKGIELAGFHRASGQERRIRGIRQPTVARALVLRYQDVQTAIVSLDILAVSRDFVKRVQNRVAKQTGIAAENVRICATHTHSMPTFRYLRQWGAIPKDYQEVVEKRIAQAVAGAKKDLAPAGLFVGKERAVGGNFNRTTASWKTDKDFTKDATDAERWLDTMVHVLHFQRGKDKQSLLWYHFSAHPVCYTDEQAGPDWPGLVADKVREEDKLALSFLQGHAGDVNPGDGKPWLGDPHKIVKAVYAAVRGALNKARRVKVDRLRVLTAETKVPLNIPLLKEQRAQYQKNPAQCKGGEWVDARFAEEWALGAAKWDLQQTNYVAALSALRLGELGMVFHPSELYSYYGLEIRRDSPFEDTVVVGYTDDMIGYLPDPKAYQSKEYAAVVVPKILDLPPFPPKAAHEMSGAITALLRKVKN